MSEPKPLDQEKISRILGSTYSEDETTAAAESPRSWSLIDDFAAFEAYLQWVRGTKNKTVSLTVRFATELQAALAAYPAAEETP